MKRKTTDLEIRLNENGYKLSHKTYVGKKAEKVDEFVYLKNDGTTLYQVNVDRTRNRITSYSFTNRAFYVFNSDSIDLLQALYIDFTNEIKKIESEVKQDD